MNYLKLLTTTDDCYIAVTRVDHLETDQEILGSIHISVRTFFVKFIKFNEENFGKNVDWRFTQWF